MTAHPKPSLWVQLRALFQHSAVQAEYFAAIDRLAALRIGERTDARALQAQLTGRRVALSNLFHDAVKLGILARVGLTADGRHRIYERRA